MNKNSVAFALSLVLAAAAGSSMAADDMKPARSPTDATMMPGGAESTTLGQGSGVRPESGGEMKAEKRVDQRTEGHLDKSMHGDTGRGQGSGTVMSNRGEKKAQMRDDQRAATPVRKAATGETGKGQGSGLRKEDSGTMGSSGTGMKSGSDNTGTMTR